MLFGPFFAAWPIGWTGVRYTTSKPMSATAGRRSAAVRRVPELPAVLGLVVASALAAREELVPGADEGALALDEQRQVARGADHVAQRPFAELDLDRGVGAGPQPHPGRS